MSKLEQEIKIDAVSFKETLTKLRRLIQSKNNALMTLFLILYALGLFMQDFVLEPFAINDFNFTEDDVGRVVIWWSTLTLIFVPIGSYLEAKISRSKTIIIGLGNGSIGLVLLSISSLINSEYIFFSGLTFFGIGNGLASSPSIGIMLDVAGSDRKNMSILLAFFGILISLSRSIGSIIAGLILFLTSRNYVILFGLEAIILLLSIKPILEINKDLDLNVTNNQYDKFTDFQLRQINLND